MEDIHNVISYCTPVGKSFQTESQNKLRSIIEIPESLPVLRYTSIQNQTQQS